MTNDPNSTPDPAAPGLTPASPTAPRREPLRIQLGRWFLKAANAPTDKTDDNGSRWPGSRRQFLWDLVPGEIAPGSDGVIPPPRGEELAWTSKVDDEDVVATYERARRYRLDADDTTRNLELKASRFATFLVALLTANVALVVFEISRLGAHPDSTRIILVAVSGGLGLWSARWLVPGLIQAVDADQRMGITSVSTLDDVAMDPRTALRDEVHGFNTSNWTRQKKASTLIFARAAVSRSLVCLIPSTLLAVVLVIHYTLTETQSNDRGQGTTPSPARSAVAPAPTPAAKPAKTPTPTKRP